MIDNDVKWHIANSEEYTNLDEQNIFYSKLGVNTEDNIDIFICSHTDFVPPVSNKAYKIITSPKVKITIDNGLDVFYEKDNRIISKFQRSFGESTRAYWISKKYDKRKKYTGLCHYRTYFDFMDNIPDMDALFKVYDAVCAIDTECTESYCMNMYDTVKRAHDINDFLEMCSYIPKLYPDYTYDEIETYLHMPQLGVRNMVIMKNEDFDKWVDFWWSISSLFNKNHNLKNSQDVYEYVNKKKSLYIDKDHLKEDDIRSVDYQARMNGFYVERLMTIFFRHNFKKIFQMPLKVTDVRTDSKKYTKKKKIAVCAIAKGENRYIREWVEYYRDLGVDDIYIYDNNDTYGEHFEDVIGDYIDEGWVKIFDTVRGNFKYCQYDCYNIFFNKYKKKYEWITFLDIDEFITLNNDETLPDYLNRKIFKDKHQILLNWVCYDDSDKLLYEEGKVTERFTRRMISNNNLEGNSYYFGENDTVKCILHASLLTKYIDIIDAAHRINDKKLMYETPGLNLITCNNKGDIITTYDYEFVKHDEELAYIKHFITKTAEEYAYKMLRGDVNNSVNRIAKKFFFKCNKFSYSKLLLINKIIGSNEKESDDILLLSQTGANKGIQLEKK